MSQICDNHIHFNLDFANEANFQSLEVVDRGSETQLQVAENLNFLAQCSKGWDVLNVNENACLVSILIISQVVFVSFNDNFVLTNEYTFDMFDMTFAWLFDILITTKLDY